MTVYIRKLDGMGRIVLPAEYRKEAMIEDMGEVKITEDNGKIIIERLKSTCKICRSEESINEQFMLCEDCIKKIKAL